MTSLPARIWEETVTIPTYPAPPPDLNPMFFENRANQGVSGRVYPNPFTDRVNHERKIDQPYQAVFLENEYIQLIVLPRFGGRIHLGLAQLGVGNDHEAQERFKSVLSLHPPHWRAKFQLANR